MKVLILDRCEHPERRVAALAVVEDLEVFEHRVGELDASLTPEGSDSFDVQGFYDKLLTVDEER